MGQKIKLFEEIANREEIAAKLTSTENVEEILAIFAENGLEVSADEMAEIVKEVSGETSADELSEDDLDAVAGGGIQEAAQMIARWIIKNIVEPIRRAQKW